uniref:Uncharacterized protein n=1 Tax=Arundo donax TaxID=35708 RepID=A0A0A8Z7V1_ARUDO
MKNRHTGHEQGNGYKLAVEVSLGDNFLVWAGEQGK